MHHSTIILSDNMYHKLALFDSYFLLIHVCLASITVAGGMTRSATFAMASMLPVALGSLSDNLAAANNVSRGN